MWNLNDDNELDKLSREAAESYPLDQATGSWDKLHARLDAEMPEKRRRRYLLFFLLFLVVGSAGFWVSRMNGDESLPQLTSENQSASSKNTDANAVRSPESIRGVPSNRDKANQTTGASTTDASNINIASTEKKVKPANYNPIRETRDAIKQTSQSRTNSESQARRIQHKNQTSGRTGNVTGTAVVANGHDTNPKSDTRRENLNENDDAIASDQTTGKKGDQTTAMPKDDQSSTQPSPNTEKKEQPVEEPKKTDPVEKPSITRDNTRWIFGAVYAPDISTVHFSHTQPLGLNIGVTVDYKLNDKFSLQTGVIYTKKNYKLNGDDYHPPKGTWFDYVNMKEVTGSCTMFDIPLNLRFNAVRKKTSNIFFSAGLSSYLMKNEDYSYYFDYQGVPTTRDRSYPTSDNYVLSIINISAGFEKKLNNSFSLQVEPFFKQSLTGVGFGEISLNSTGIYFSLRYNPLKPAKASKVKKK